MLFTQCLNDWELLFFSSAVAVAAKSLQSCPTLCDPIDSSPPGSTVPGILQARTLEWVAISFSNVWKWKVKGKSLSCVPLFATPWTAAHQAPPSMGLSRPEYWNGVPLPLHMFKTIISHFMVNLQPTSTLSWKKQCKRMKLLEVFFDRNRIKPETNTN